MTVFSLLESAFISLIQTNFNKLQTMQPRLLQPDIPSDFLSRYDVINNKSGRGRCFPKALVVSRVMSAESEND